MRVAVSADLLRVDVDSGWLVRVADVGFVLVADDVSLVSFVRLGAQPAGTKRALFHGRLADWAVDSRMVSSAGRTILAAAFHAGECLDLALLSVVLGEVVFALKS